MSLMEKVTSAVTGKRTSEPVGKLHVVDPSPYNWLYITYNTVEELVRVSANGTAEPAAMKTYRWIDDCTLEIDVREDEQFADGEALTAATVKRSFDEQMRWAAPHPPGTHFNPDPRATCEVTGEHQVRLHYPEPDGLGLGKLRATHIMNTRFWNDIGFGYQRNGSGEGHW